MWRPPFVRVLAHGGAQRAGVTITGASSKVAHAAVPAVATDTTFTFRLTVTNDHGLADMKEAQVQARAAAVQPVPPTIVISGPATVKTGEAVVLDASGSSSSNPGASPLSFTWKVPPGISGAQVDAATVRFTAPGVSSSTTYPFEVTATDGKASASKTHQVTVVPSTGCIPTTDPGAAQYPQWDAAKTYAANDEVQHNAVV